MHVPNRWTQQRQTVHVHWSCDVDGTGYFFCDLDPKVKGQLMYFLVNASTPKLLDVATSNFAYA